MAFYCIHNKNGLCFLYSIRYPSSNEYDAMVSSLLSTFPYLVKGLPLLDSQVSFYLKKMFFFLLPIFDHVIMDGHPIFWVVDTGAANIHHDRNIGCPSIMTWLKMDKRKNSHSYLGFHYSFSFYQHDLFVRNTVASFSEPNLNNHSPHEK